MLPAGSQLYWDLRPSTHVPTVEFRTDDVCTDSDDAVLHAALCRSLVATLGSAADAVRALLAELRDDLKGRSALDEVTALAATGDPGAVVRDLLVAGRTTG